MGCTCGGGFRARSKFNHIYKGMALAYGAIFNGGLYVTGIFGIIESYGGRKMERFEYGNVKDPLVFAENR